jgi:hypothetical protein
MENSRPAAPRRAGQPATRTLLKGVHAMATKKQGTLGKAMKKVVKKAGKALGMTKTKSSAKKSTAKKKKAKSSR